MDNNVHAHNHLILIVMLAHAHVMDMSKIRNAMLVISHVLLVMGLAINAIIIVLDSMCLFSDPLSYFSVLLLLLLFTGKSEIEEEESINMLDY